MGLVPIDSYVKLPAINTRLKGLIALLLPGTPLPFDQDLWDDYLLKEPIFTTENGEVPVARSKESDLTGNTVMKQGPLKQLSSHFIRVFTFMVERGAAPASDFELLDLTENGEVPYMGSESALLNVSANLINGEANRVAVGHTPMTNPSIAEVSAAKISFETALSLQNQQNPNVKKESADVETPFEANKEAAMELVNNVRYRGRKRPFSEVRDLIRSLGFSFTPEPGEVERY